METTGFLDGLEGGTVRGWCRSVPGDAVVVILDGRIIGSVTPDLYREDLDKAGKGACAFEFELPDEFCDGLPHEIICTSRQTLVDLVGSGQKYVVPASSDLVDNRQDPFDIDPVYYRSMYADLAHMTDEEAVRHYREYGHREGRKVRLADRHARRRAIGFAPLELPRQAREASLSQQAAREATAPNTSRPSILDAYVRASPSVEAAFDLFKDEWSSIIPGVGLGHADLFNDHRIRWFEEKVGGFDSKRVLELGPLEGAHTFMMAARGASVVAIEANTRAFMKCLIVHNAMKFNAQFMLGDFRPYLASTEDRFDLVVASAVLYHMTDPAELLRGMCRVSNAIGIWTHYYDPKVIAARPNLAKKFDTTPRFVDVMGRRIEMFRQSYLDALDWEGFCGGADEFSYWLTLEGIRNTFDACGFDVEVGADESNHPNGPCATLFASRR